MITYQYEREDGTRFNLRQRITEDKLEVCPETGQKVRRVITSDPTVMFMGKGWDKNRRLKETQQKERRTDPLYTTDSTYKKKLDDRLENDHELANAYEEKKYELKKKFE